MRTCLSQSRGRHCARGALALCPAPRQLQVHRRAVGGWAQRGWRAPSGRGEELPALLCWAEPSVAHSPLGGAADPGMTAVLRVPYSLCWGPPAAGCPVGTGGKAHFCPSIQSVCPPNHPSPPPPVHSIHPSVHLLSLTLGAARLEGPLWHMGRLGLYRDCSCADTTAWPLAGRFCAGTQNGSRCFSVAKGKRGLSRW